LGSQLGLKQLIKDNFKGKKVYAIGDSKEMFPFLNIKLDKIPSDKILNKSLGIVVDANFSDRIECNEILTEEKLGAVIRIDHHPNDDDVNYVER
jgi:phosphoesterase RecJ-like protein